MTGYFARTPSMTRYALARAQYRVSANAKKPPSQFEAARFVAIDGEGFNEGGALSIDVGTPPHRYTGHRHSYALLMASDGSEAYSAEGALTTPQCLDFLIAAAQNTPHAVLVCFGASYDVTHMLRGSLTRDEIVELLRGGDGFTRRIITVRLGAHDYRIEYRPRKSLTVWRWPAGAVKYEAKKRKDGSVRWQLSPHDKAVLWDVWGFFQGSFVKALQDWLPHDPDTAMIVDMKSKRSVFARADIDTIRAYTTAELRCLTTLMDAVRDSLRVQGLSITRWDGAGSIAGALFKKHAVKDHMADCPEAVFLAARVAYSGGHIEACKLGYHQGEVYHYDINSAYPYQFFGLPSLAGGEWIAGTGEPPPGFTLVKIHFHFKSGMPFYPLFHRSERGAIRYPQAGAGWYWHAEYAAAAEFARVYGAVAFAVAEWHHMKPSTNEGPFSWIAQSYARRQEIIAQSRRTGIPNGEEKTIKLGLNSCYGKTAQQVGARFDQGELIPPAYFQIEWAGAVTSGCRAQLMMAAMQDPDAIVSFATDALFSVRPLDVYCPQAKELGAWEAQTHTGMTIVMPGVYWLHDDPTAKNPSGMTHYSRGMSKEIMSDVQIVHRAWREKRTHIEMQNTTMVTLGAASMSDNFWPLRGLFVTASREVKMNGQNSKRYPVSLSQCAPHREMVPTWPQSVYEASDAAEDVLSAAYPLDWLDAEAGGEGGSDAAAEREMLDSVDAADASFFV